MSSNTFISVWVRDGIKRLMELAAVGKVPVVMTVALGSVRKRFPDLDVTDKELTEGIMGEAAAAGAVVIRAKPRATHAGRGAGINGLGPEMPPPPTLLDRLVKNHKRA